MWTVSHKADTVALPYANAHYNRQTPDSPQFVPPGRSVVLLRPGALWVTSWPMYAQHAWVGAWVNTLFRRESGPLASDLIRDAVAATRSFWPPPPEGIVTFVDASRVQHKRQPGRCYLKAGWRQVGETKGGLLVFQQLPDAMPDPVEPAGFQRRLFA